MGPDKAGSACELTHARAGEAKRSVENALFIAKNEDRRNGTAESYKHPKLADLLTPDLL